jgi:hypothetical protein
MTPMLWVRILIPLHKHRPGHGASDQRSTSLQGMHVMSEQAFRLLERHQKLDSRLRMLQGLRWPDPLELARLKKLKLAIKDRLARVARLPARAQR